MRRMLVVAVGLGLVLSACEMRGEVVVNPDGSGTIGIAFGMEPLVAGSIPTGPTDPFEFFALALQESGLPWRFEEFSEPGLSGRRATLPFENFEDLRDTIKDVSSLDAAGGGGFGETFELARTADGGWSLRATTEPVEPTLTYDGDDGLTPKYLPAPVVPTAPPGTSLLDTFGQESFDPSEFTAPNPLEGFDRLFRVEFHVTLPGKAASHNATEAVRTGRSTRFVWRLGEGGGATELIATTTPAGAALPYIPIGIALAALGGGAVFMLRRKPIGGPPPVVLEGFHPSPASMDAGGGLPEDQISAPAEPGTRLDEPGPDELAV